MEGGGFYIFQGISQKKLEELSGVSQPVIARMETGKTSPQLDTVLKVLASLGKTLAVVSLEQGEVNQSRLIVFSNNKP
ncbi:helix-turn-helix transcriptional regulator [Streptococcus sp. IMAU 99125]|uniref:Helix-turn-helix transcriptional regulator n=1 Tax=Streptococcus humanilactis TaxID=2841061 RepID=A0ABS7DUB2_9STRE|nr:helix-turn-helix transcriptional regulator [Streptococcus humanilactis]MBW7579631.1 helix-turn-helix transcriptional regulator [Streptococcus humanilactis]MBW7581493.1 helix-turn-helix transcriptional regulator [Streptococcus humanilactis]